jgi:hypothetical protein
MVEEIAQLCGLDNTMHHDAGRFASLAFRRLGADWATRPWELWAQSVK